MPDEMPFGQRDLAKRLIALYMQVRNLATPTATESFGWHELPTQPLAWIPTGCGWFNKRGGCGARDGYGKYSGMSLDKVIQEKAIPWAAREAAVQNMMLTAHALGLGAVWNSDMIDIADEVQEMYNQKHDFVMALCVGYPSVDEKKTVKVRVKNYAFEN